MGLKGVKTRLERRYFKGTISTDMIGSEVGFEFEASDNATEDEIDTLAKEEAFNWVNWYYEEINN